MWYNLKEIFRINMKNKVITGLLGFLVVLGMATPALADGTTPAYGFTSNDPKTQSQSATTKLETDQTDSHYVMSIPASAQIKFNALDTNIGNLVVSGNINGSKMVTVDVTGDNGVKGQGAFDNNGAKLPYTVTDGSKKLETLNVKADMINNGQSVTTPLHVNILQQDWNAAKSGKYTGHITFAANIADAQ